MSEKSAESADSFKGWLWKWTNYIKGYQRRWFVLSNGLLSYYRSQAEMAHTCRGTINLAGAFIITEDACNFMISNGSAQTFHLKANNEVERQRWITALELAKSTTLNVSGEHDSSDEDSLLDVYGDEDSGGSNGESRGDLQHTIRLLNAKLDDLVTCNDLISKHGSALQRGLSDIEMAGNSDETNALSTVVKGVNERATLFRITSSAMINTSSEFLQLALAQGKRWQKAIAYERERRMRLEETVETLAKQHNTLERALNTASGPPSNEVGPPATISNHLDIDPLSEEEDEFVDASDNAFTSDVDLTQNHNNKTTAAAAEEELSLDLSKYVNRPRRKKIPNRPNLSINMWNIIKNAIGKDISKVPLPVNFNEPLSMLQRLAEDIEFCDLLHQAAKCTNSQEQMGYILAFSVSSYASTIYRTGKPFNPLLGETYDLDRRGDLGVRILCEQVSHHPPVAAIYFESHDFSSSSGWCFWADISVSGKFRGKYLSVTPHGTMHVKFPGSGNHYTWKKATTTVNNIIVGKLWIDQSGDVEIINHTTGDTCKHKFIPYSYFSRDIPRRVTGLITDSKDKAHYVVSGTWDDHIEIAKIISVDNSNKAKPAYKTLPNQLIWKKNELPEGAEKMYFFTELTCSLNEKEEGVAPTDSRHRQDQHLTEIGDWDDANEMKHRLEEAQRGRRRRREAEASARKAANLPPEPYKPKWFNFEKCPLTLEDYYVFNNEYWGCKAKQDWSRCVPIYHLPDSDDT